MTTSNPLELDDLDKPFALYRYVANLAKPLGAAVTMLVCHNSPSIRVFYLSDDKRTQYTRTFYCNQWTTESKISDYMLEIKDFLNHQIKTEGKDDCS